MRPYVSLWDLISPYASLCVVKGPYRSLFDFRDSDGSLCVLINPCASLWIFTRLYRSL